MFNQIFTPPLFSDMSLVLPTIANRLCISVIDETSQTTATAIQNSWNTFRSRFPERKFYLLYPKHLNPPSFYTDLKVPTNFNVNNNGFGPFIVNRDSGVVSNASDWYTICNLDSLPNGSTFELLIDNSGSMTTSTVRASLNLLNQKIASRNITYILRANTRFNVENWVEPFLV